MRLAAAKLRGRALNWAVAQCEGLLVMEGIAQLFSSDFSDPVLVLDVTNGRYVPFLPGQSWAHAGPIIGRQFIALDWTVHHDKGQALARRRWTAKSESAVATSHLAPTAAMRAHVMAQMGSMVDVPKLFAPRSA
jgi:hypothetical protein